MPVKNISLPSSGTQGVSTLSGSHTYHCIPIALFVRPRGDPRLPRGTWSIATPAKCAAVGYRGRGVYHNNRYIRWGKCSPVRDKSAYRSVPRIVGMRCELNGQSMTMACVVMSTPPAAVGRGVAPQANPKKTTAGFRQHNYGPTAY